MTLFGGAWAVLYWFSTDVFAQWLAEKKTARLFKKSPQSALSYAQKALGGKAFDRVLLAWLLLLLATVPIFGAFVPLMASPFIFGGFLGMSALLALVNGRRWMRNFRIGAAKRIGRFFLTKGDRGTIDQFLKESYQQDLPGVRSAAIENMGEWGSDVAVKLLSEARKDPDLQVALAATNTLNEVLKRLDAASPMSMAALDTLLTEYEHWTMEAEEHAASPEKAQDFLQKRKLVEWRIEEILLSQMHLRNSYPDLFCMECHTRSEELVRENWRYVRCTTCKEAKNLRRGIQTVIGRVGGMPSDTLQDGVLYVSLWDEASASSRPAEVDKIEIKAGEQFNYDWAVSSVVEAMQNRFPDKDVKVPVELDGEISLGGNTLNILNRIKS